jgi:hypothetical protein
MTIGRTERRLAERMLCKHCNRMKDRGEMEMLGCGLPSDCCKECWREFRDRYPVFAPASRIDDEPADKQDSLFE